MLKCTFCHHDFEHEGGEGAPCPRCQGTETVPLPEPPPSVVVIRFAAPGSTVFKLEIEGHVTPGQLIVAGQMLVDEGRMNGLMPHILQAAAEAVAQRLEQPKIAVPGMTPVGVSQILAGMRGD